MEVDVWSHGFSTSTGVSMAEPDFKLLKELRDYLNTTKGRRVTTLGGLSSQFDMSPTEMLSRVGPDPVIRDRLERNSARVKEQMRETWRNSDKPNLLISAYRLEADEDELIRLSGESPKSKSLERKDPLLEVLKPEEVWSNG